MPAHDKSLTLFELVKNSKLPRKISETIIGDLFEISPEELFLQAKKIKADQKRLKRFKKIEDKILAGAPPSYALGRGYFYDREFRVNRSVLIPRPETELLVEAAIKFLKSLATNHHPLTIIDIGTGSGCMIISVFKKSEFLTFYATDISSAALKLAKQNAALHHAKIKFFKSDLFSNKKLPAKFDLILANLPYLTRDETKKLKGEPPKALYGGKDGFDIISRLIKKLPGKLNDNGLTILEIGYNLDQKIKKLIREYGLNVQIEKDLNGFSRFALITKKFRRA